MAIIGTGVFNPPPASIDQPRVHLKLLFEALAAHNLDGKSILETISSQIYRVEIEVNAREKVSKNIKLSETHPMA